LCFKVIAKSGTTFLWKSENVFDKKFWINDITKAVEDLPSRDSFDEREELK